MMRNVFGALLLLVSAFALFGQNDTGTILGVVTDSSVASIPNAQVVIENQGTSATQKLATNDQGDFTSAPLGVGKYRVTVTAPGFTTKIYSDLVLRVSDRMRLPVSLQPGLVQQTLEVTGESPLIDTASTTLGGVVTEQQVHD